MPLIGDSHPGYPHHVEHRGINGNPGQGIRDRAGSDEMAQHQPQVGHRCRHRHLVSDLLVAEVACVTNTELDQPGNPMLDGDPISIALPEAPGLLSST